MIITNRKLGVLAVVAVVMLMSTIILYSDSYAPKTDFQKGAPLIQGLDPAKVATVKLHQGGKTVTLNTNNEGGFVIKERDNYPASVEKVRKFLLDCLNVKCADKITEEIKNHASFEVLADSSEGVTVRFLDRDGETLIGLVVGKNSEQGTGTYVRRIDQDAVYVSENMLLVKVDPTAFMESTLFKFKAKDVAELLVNRQGEIYTLSRNDENKITLKDPPKGKRGKEYAITSLFNEVENLILKDVALTGKKEIAWKNRVSFKLKSGAAYKVRFGEDGNQDHYIQLQAEQRQGTVNIPNNATADEIKEKEAQIAAITAANEFNQLHDGWDYKISKWTAQKICKPLSDLLEDAPEIPVVEPVEDDGEKAIEGDPKE